MTNRGKNALIILLTCTFCFGLTTWWKKLVPKFSVKIEQPTKEKAEKDVDAPHTVYWSNDKAEPNYLPPTSPILLENNTLIQTGFRDDGTVVWRQQKK